MDNWGAYAVCRSRFGHLARSPPDLHTGGCVGVPSGSAVCAGSLGTPTRGVPTPVPRADTGVLCVSLRVA